MDKNGTMLEYRQLIKRPEYRQTWLNSCSNELGRLMQGRNSTQLAGTNTMTPIKYIDVPEDRRKDITYGRLVVDHRPQKTEPDRTRLTVGGNRINYPDSVATPTAELQTVKLLFNSVLSTPGAKFMCLDIGNFYLGTHMERPEFMFLPLDLIPEEMQQQYNMQDVVHNGKVYFRITKGMYGLPQAGKLANKQLVKNLAPFGYKPCRFTPGLWKHEWRPITFTLVVDDFGVKYVGKEHADHLIQTLQSLYPKVSIDWSGSLYCGLSLQWDYHARTMDMSMPGYIANMLHRFNHDATPPQYAPFPVRPIQYGVTMQEEVPHDTSEILNDAQKTLIQQIIGTLLYYARAVDMTLLAALSSVASQQSKPTKQTWQHVQQILNYVATYPNTVIRFQNNRT